MRVLYFHQYFVVPGGSGGIRSYQFAKRLVDNGHSVDLITTSAFLDGFYSLSRGWNVVACDGIRLHILKLDYSNKFGFLKRIFVFLSFAIMAAVYSLRLRCDVVFATSTPLTIGVPAVIKSKLSKTPLVFEVRDLWPAVPIAMGILKGRFSIFVAHALERWIYASSSRIIALSRGMADGVYTVSGKIAEVIPNAADIDLFSVNEGFDSFLNAYPVLKNERYVVYTGTLGRVNNIDYLVDLARELRANFSDINVVIFGDGSELERIKSLAASCDVLGKNFHIFSPVPKDKLPFVLRGAVSSISTVLPIPELFNNSANKFFDALAAGVPISINHGGWQADLIQQHSLGLVLDGSSPSNAAKQLINFAADGHAINAARVNASILARDEFSRDILFKKFQSVLESVSL